MFVILCHGIFLHFGAAADEHVFTRNKVTAKWTTVAARMNSDVMPKARAQMTVGKQRGVWCSGPNVAASTVTDVSQSTVMTHPQFHH